MFTKLFPVLLISVIWAPSMVSTADEQAFYGPDDKIVLLNKSTVTESMFHSDKAWLVQFYADWCPYSAEFIPTYKLLAQDVQDLRNSVVLAAFNCGGKSNKKLCRQFRVKAYPTLRFFPPNSSAVGVYKNKSSTYRGRKIMRADSSEIKEKLMSFLQPQFPNLLSSTNNKNASVNRAMSAELWTSSEIENSRPVSSRSMASVGQDEIPERMAINNGSRPVDSGSEELAGNERKLHSTFKDRRHARPE